MIVSFVGVVGSGKNFNQDLLVKQGYVALDFKDALLDMTEDLVGYKVRENYDYFKENIVGLTAPAASAHLAMARTPAHNITSDLLRHYPAAMTGRRLLQRLGTEVMRKRDPDYWVNEWRRAATEHLYLRHNIAVADCRFPNEMDAIKRLSKYMSGLVPGVTFPCKFIFCDYRSSRYDATLTHESEKLAQSLLAKGYKDGDEIREGE